MRLFVAALLLFIPGYTLAQLEPAPLAQELEPVQNALTYHTPAYHVRMRHLLFNRAERGSEFQFLCMPSFRPETLLTVRRTGEGYIAQVLRPEKQIWSFKGDDKELNVTEKKKRLPSPLAERTRGLWQTMLLRTTFQRRNRVLDGISYVFLGHVPGYFQLTAESCNPESGTKPKMLASIGGLLIAYVEASPDQEEDIQKRVAELMDQLDAAIKTNPEGIVRKLAEPQH
jgi:hypothetical protein